MTTRITNRGLSLFTGYPYIICRLIPSLYHISLLSEESTVAELIEISKVQAQANQLPLCLVLGAAECIYIEGNGEIHLSSEVPLALFVASEKLRLPCAILLTPDLVIRRKMLMVFEKKVNGTESCSLVGDLNKGGRHITAEETAELQGKNGDGSPKGLVKCQNCAHYRGQCKDPEPKFKTLLVKVFCACENNNLCAFCGSTLYPYKLNANFYLPEDGHIHYVPAFCALDHECKI